MLKGLLNKVVGDPNEREVHKLQPLVQAINGLEPEMERRTNAELRALSDQLRARLAQGETLDSLLPSAFAAVREAAKRTVDMRPFDVQLIGGIVLHQGKVAEMKTGEGKTLVATMPITLNALSGRGVHLVTVNDYLARRDVQWMGPIYHLLGLRLGLLQSGADQPAYLYDPAYQRDPFPGLRPVARRDAYAADITYGTNNEFGFDYLRDNLALSLDRRVQRPLFYAIVDEVDNIFIDEARTPLIISGPSDEPVEEYGRFAAIAVKLERDVHYDLDEKERNVFLTEAGLAVVERETGIANIYDEANYRYVHYMQQALKAQVLFLEGRDYIRDRKRIVLIDQHTGRLMPDRRLSEGLHQAIEAKEGVPVRPRDVVSATITIQNYFRMYQKLGGMSGTALTEAEEFFKIYKLDVVTIPTNKPVVRSDQADTVYRSEEAKFRAVARQILACHIRGQPVLVGTTSVEMSEQLSKRLSGERLQMAALAPQIADALAGASGRSSSLDRQQRAALRETLNTGLEAMNPVAWRKLVRDLDLNPNALAPENLDWIMRYLELPDEVETGSSQPIRKALEQSLREGILHQILNAKEHTREAAIIAGAGEPGTITIATNMAGRGVDIKLGGELSYEVMHRAHQALLGRGLDPFSATPAQMDSAIAEVVPQYARSREQVLSSGGLYVLGTERHEARRIDNQLRGRSGRQGEPGSSRFYLSLEDDLMRRFGRKEMLSKLMEQMGDDFPIEHSLVSKTIERAQTSVEGYNFDIRKHLLEYDDVLNRQRETIYGERLRILKSEDLRLEIWQMLEDQVDEYLQKALSEGAIHGAGSIRDGDELRTHPERQRLMFAGLDDVAPLLLQAPNTPFPGPLTFGTHLTAFPPFTISFLADQFADQDLHTAQNALRALHRQAAASYLGQMRLTVSEITRATREKYDEHLGRYQTLLDEKLDDYVQLSEERGQPLDPLRLAQHLERTYPIKLTRPSAAVSLPGRTGRGDLDDWREFWLAEVQAEFHRQTCTGLMDRVQIRFPADTQGGLDRLRPARIIPAKLVEEMQRVLELAARQPIDTASVHQLDRLRSAVPSDPDPAQVLQFVTAIKANSQLDCGRLDRLMGHVLGAYLDELIGQYLNAVDAEQRNAPGLDRASPQGRLRRDLEQLQASVTEGKKGGRTDHLLGVLSHLNSLVHLEIPELGELLSQAIAHEFDKWAQRQVLEIEASANAAPLLSTSWASIAEHLMASHFTQKQIYDREHQRRVAWTTRLPLSYVAQAHAEAMDPASTRSPDSLRAAILATLRWVLEQREQAWGHQELKRWSHLSTDALDQESHDSLLRYLGEQELGELRDTNVEDLPQDLYDRLRFILAFRQWETENMRLGNLPQSLRDPVLDRLGQRLRDEILNKPVGELDAELQDQIVDSLRQTGFLDDSEARGRLLEQPIRDWERQTRDEVAVYWGQRLVEAHKTQPLHSLEATLRVVVLAYLQRQRRFVDEEQVQRFLVRQRLSELPPQTKADTLLYLARFRLERLSRRKISSLDINNRQGLVESLQRMGLFTDQARREELLAASTTLSSLEPRVRAGFGTFLARFHLAEHTLSELDATAREFTLQQLRQAGLLDRRQRIEELANLRLPELDAALRSSAAAPVAADISQQLVRQLQADLAAKPMADLAAETRRLVHQALDEQDYFVDPEKVTWYERKTLAQLPSDLLHGLEQHLGQIRLKQVADTSFRDLPVETQESLLAFLDGEKLLADRAARLRLTQVGVLGELPDDVQDRVAQHLGRQWLVQIRDQRPTSLPDPDRKAVWAFLRSQGTVADEFKEELFAYQRLDEFDEEIKSRVQSTLTQQLTTALANQPIGKLPSEMQAEVRARLIQADYFVDQPKSEQVSQSPIRSLPSDLRQGIEKALGTYLTNDLESVPIAKLPSTIQTAFWQYLDDIGYFVDEKKRSQVLDRRLVDLNTDVYGRLVADLAEHLGEEIGDSFVADLDDDLRQGLREALEELGYFESDQLREQALGQSLGSLRREDLDVLASDFGRGQLDTWSNLRLLDLPEADRETILASLQSRDWFLDRTRLEQMQAQTLRDLPSTAAVPVQASLRDSLFQSLAQKQMDSWRKRRLVDLDRTERRIVHEVLREQGLPLEESQIRPIQRQRISQLDQGVFYDLLRELGSQVADGWGPSRFRDLDSKQQALLSAYLGQKIMGRIEQRILLHTISRLWIDYLTDIEDLRRGIGLEAYGQRDPLIEYKRRAFELFEELRENIRRTAVRSLFRQPPEPLRTQ